MESKFTKEVVNTPFEKKFISDDEYILTFKSKLSHRSAYVLKLTFLGIILGLILSLVRGNTSSHIILIFFVIAFFGVWYQNPKKLKIRVTKEGIYFREIKNIFNEDFVFKYTRKRQLSFKDFSTYYFDDDRNDESYIYASPHGGKPMRLTGYVQQKAFLNNQINHFNPERY